MVEEFFVRILGPNLAVLFFVFFICAVILVSTLGIGCLIYRIEKGCWPWN